MNRYDRVLIGLMRSSFVAASVFWVLQFYEYFYLSLSKGWVGFLVSIGEALIMFLPILIVAEAGGVILCLPLYFIFQKFIELRKVFYISGGGLVSIIIYVFMYKANFALESLLYSFVSGLAGGWVMAVYQNNEEKNTSVDSDHNDMEP